MLYILVKINNLRFKFGNKFVKLTEYVYFDATRNVHREVRRQKKTFLYSIVMHDTRQKCIILFAEFISTAHDQDNISKYLQIIRLMCETNSINKTNTIITDQSWALINAVMISFNNFHLSNYLNWCFIILFKKTEDKELINLMSIRLYLCSTHFLKNFIKKTKIIACKSYVKKTFIFMVTLIQNAATVKQIENYMINIHNVFNNKYLDPTVIYSLNLLSTEIKNMKLGHIDTEYDSFLTDQKERDRLFDIFYKFRF